MFNYSLQVFVRISKISNFNEAKLMTSYNEENHLLCVPVMVVTLIVIIVCVRLYKLIYTVNIQISSKIIT